MWKNLEARRQEAELDPAKEAGSDIFELESSYPGVQRLHALGAQVRGKTRQKAAQEEPEKNWEGGHGAAMGVGAGGGAAMAEEGLRSVADVPSYSLFPASRHGWLAGILAHAAVDSSGSRSCGQEILYVCSPILTAPCILKAPHSMGNLLLVNLLMAVGLSSGVDTLLRLVTLFRDKEPHQEPVNAKLATWKQDLSRRLQELEEAAAVSTRAFASALAYSLAAPRCCLSLQTPFSRDR